MSALAALARAYDSLATRGEVPAFGYARTDIGFCIVIDENGSPAFPPIDLRDGEGTKKTSRRLDVPTPLVQRTSGIAPNFLWDKTAYSLGITEADGKRTAKEHHAFVTFHHEVLSKTTDAGLRAFLGFLHNWDPSQFETNGWPTGLKDQNVIFALRDEYRGRFLHERAASQEYWKTLYTRDPASIAGCLLTGQVARVARAHSPIKGVWDAQSSGAFIVSYNASAFTSYGHHEGDNAPISEVAAFAYTTALNRFLEKGSGHRLQIGDASTVFWADAGDAGAAAEAEDIFTSFLGVNEKEETGKVAEILKAIHDGRPIEDIKPNLTAGVRFFVLALAPNAARLSVRFYIEDDFGVIAERYARHVQRMRIEPPPREAMPSMWRLLIETATLRKSENIVPNLAGEWMRAILTGAPYPLTLLSTLLMRLRADHDVNALRVAIIKSVLIRNFGESFKREVPVSLDLENQEPGYLLGRLFAVYEQIQTAALGRNVNATIKDKFYGAAASQPQKIFPMLDKGSRPHLSKIGKDSKGHQIVLERKVAEIMEVMAPDADPFPAHLPDRQQGLFALGYYHQRSDFFAKHDDKAEKRAIEEPVV
jgi:CRISPR-associated protein Csd1